MLKWDPVDLWCKVWHISIATMFLNVVYLALIKQCTSIVTLTTIYYYVFILLSKYVTKYKKHK